jgi:hypothetical protein
MAGRNAADHEKGQAVMIITEKDGRLLIQFWRDGYEVRPDGQMVMHPNQILDKEIDITTHMERAVENVLARRGE